MINIFSQLMTEANKELFGLTLDPQNASEGPFVLGNGDFFIEIPVAFGCSFSDLTLTGANGTALPDAAELIDRGTEVGVESRLCSAIKVASHYLTAGLIRTPDMIITSNSCCDAMDTLGNLMNGYKPWAHIPRFAMDAPHSFDDASYEYFGKQLRQAVTFMEDVTGRKMDWDRLKEVCIESNKQGQLLLEFQELKKAIPCPANPDLARQGTEIKNWTKDRISPMVTTWLEQLVSAAEQRVKEGKGIDGVDEKIRFLWQDLAGSWASGTVLKRLQTELGAVCIMDYVSFGTWTPIDLSSEEAMFTSFGKRFLLEDPMNRQALHNTELFCNDILQIVKDFKCDAVVMPAHISHRDTNSRLKVVKDMCREKGIPCLVLGIDIWDKRYMTPDVAFDRMKTFFEVSGLLT
ncbi:MAG: 2-hydroxyacyl-CoA dehydratase family protein [Ignavibacteriae bacterium]|nr:2-hydroxyacyl-CoA dehydratase family protein [Ignavibacteriota bacterium]